MVLMEFMAYGTLQNVSAKVKNGPEKIMPEDVLSAITAQVCYLPLEISHVHEHPQTRYIVCPPDYNRRQLTERVTPQETGRSLRPQSEP